MESIARLMGAFSLIGALLGFAAFWLLIGEQKSAPQVAAVSSMILAPVVCLYIFARGFEMISQRRGG